MWKLMTDNAITREQREELCEFILNTPQLTQGSVVKEFEEAWCQWQGCKYSVFVNSGSSANMIMVRALSRKNQNWICQASTWITNISPVIQNDLNLFLCDMSLRNFGPDLNRLEEFLKRNENNVLFLTHLMGMPAISDDLLGLCDKYNVTLVEDCCQAHGATFKDKKVGNFGVASTFSFYYGHHMTTIEGGMVCTDDESLYHKLLLLRSYGMFVALPIDQQKKLWFGVGSSFPDPIFQELGDAFFTFLSDGYNVKNTEVHAKLGLLQLKGLDNNIEIRNKNYKQFISGLDSNLYYTNFLDEGISSFSLPIVRRPAGISGDHDVEKLLSKRKIESRPFFGKNLSKQPLFKGTVSTPKIDYDRLIVGIDIPSEMVVLGPINNSQLLTADFLADNCRYVGNHQEVTSKMIGGVLPILNNKMPDGYGQIQFQL